MHQTTVRFGADLWHALETETGALGVSIAQYVRDAALSRLAYDAGQTNEFVPEPAAAAAQERAESETSASTALHAQSRQARSRAAELRARAERTRAKLAVQKT